MLFLWTIGAEISLPSVTKRIEDAENAGYQSAQQSSWWVLRCFQLTSARIWYGLREVWVETAILYCRVLLELRGKQSRVVDGFQGEELIHRICSVKVPLYCLLSRDWLN